MTMATVGHRVKVRKKLHDRLRVVSDATCFLGILGILLMIVNNEVSFNDGSNGDTILNWFIKLSISISTIPLIVLIIYYHKLDLKLYSVRNSVDDWYIGLTGHKLFLIILEIIICIIHPIPLQLPSSWSLTVPTATKEAPEPYSYISYDVALGLPMFARLYLIGRFLLLHSPLIHNVTSQSLGSLNQISMDVFFLLKTFLEQWPIRCLVSCCILVFLIGSWSLRACDYLPTGGHVSVYDSMWLLIVTFTTVGYGDITPTSYCGRSVATIVAFTGLLSSALLISVFAQKLVLTRWEKHVYNFVLNINLSKDRKQQAANIVKFAVKIWYLKRRDKSKSFQCRIAQWKLYRAIRLIQDVKLQQRQLMNSCLAVVDVYTLQSDGNDKTDTVIQQINIMNKTIDQIEEKFIDMKQTMIDMQFKMDLFLVEQSTSSGLFIRSTKNSIGPYCNISNSACDVLKPCHNDGRCQNAAKPSYNYSCLCPIGFDGRRCEIDNRPCQPFGCWNGGNCITKPSGTFYCLCVPGREGAHCEKRQNFCQNVTCHNRGVCRSLNQSYECVCLGNNYYYGRHCEMKTNKLLIFTRASKSCAYIAILVMVAAAMFIVTMDILKYCFGIDPTREDLERIQREKQKRKRKPVIQRFIYVNAPPSSENPNPAVAKTTV